MPHEMTMIKASRFKPTLPQIGGPAGRLPLPGAVAGPAVTVGAIGLLEKNAAATGKIVLCRGWKRRHRDDGEKRQRDRAGAVKRRPPAPRRHRNL
jgi:hypothetical protein